MEAPTIEPAKKSKRHIQIILAWVVPILLGAIGSGVWARIGEPFTNFCTSAIINGISFFFSTYKDSIYRGASYGFREYSSNELFKLFIGFALLGYLLIPFTHPWLRKYYPTRQTEPDRTQFFFRSGCGFILISIFAFAVLSSLAVGITSISYNNRIITYTQTSIDRLAPFLTEQEEEELLAEFRSVKDAKDYYTLHEKLLKLSSKHNVVLRKIDLL